MNTGTESQLQIIVDRHSCTGLGECMAIAPEMFDLDDSGIAVVRTGAVDPELARDAADACPMAAISIIEARRAS